MTPSRNSFTFWTDQDDVASDRLESDLKLLVICFLGLTVWIGCIAAVVLL